MEYYLGQISLSDPPITIPLQKDIVIVGTELLQPHIYPKMSEQHAKLYIKKDHVYIRDLFSKYGTYVNGVKIESDEDTLLNINDIICFGVNPNSIEIGFVCVLLGAKSEDSNNIINQQAVSIKKEPPEIIDLSDEDDIPKIPIDSVKTVNPNCLDFKTSDVQENAEQLRNRNLEILIEEGRECVRDVHNVPSTSRERTSFEKRYPPTKKCSAPLMECDSESYLRPPDVKDSFLFESEDEDNLSMRKKHPKRISSDSKSSSSKRSNNWKNDTSHHKKRARIISSDYSNESSVEPINSIYCKNQKLFPQQPKAENILSSSNVALPELSSSDFSVKKLDKNAYVNKNKFVNSFKIPKLSTSDSSVKSSNKNLHLNSLNKSNRETAKPSSYENYQKNIQKAEDGEKLLQIPKNINTDTRMMKSGTRKLAEIQSRTIKLEEDSRHRALNETDSYSATEKIIDESNGDDYCNIDRTHNFIPTKTEPEDAEVPEYNNFKEIFEGVDELDGPPSNVIPKNSAFENEGLETIEKIEQFVNCSAQKNSAELECGENNIEKCEAEETLFQISKNIITDTTKMKSETRKLAEIGSRTMKQEEDSCNEAFYENDSHSVAKEIINVSDGDNYFDNDRAQNFIPIKTEPEDTEVSADNIFKDSRRRYFKDDDESKGLPSNAISKTTAFENERLETIKKTEQFVNCSAQRNSAESECGENKELNSKVTDSESEMSSEDSFLPSMKSLLFPNSKSGVNNSSKSCGKILLTDPKPMTYRPRRIRGRDEGYVERQKSLDLCPKRKRGRPRKEEQIQSEAINLNSPVAITKIPNKPVERSISLNNFKLKTAPEGKNTPKAGPSGTNNVKSAIKLLSNPKSFHSCLSFDKGENGNYSEKQKSIDFFMKRKKNRPQKCSELEQEVNNSYTEKQLCEKPQKCKQKNSVNDYRTNVSLSRSTGTKESRKNTKSSVKIRPDKFSSRMGFLIHGVDAKPLRREKISENSKMYKCVSNAETNASQVQFLDIVGANGLKQNAAVENIVVSENVYPISGIEDEHSEEKRSSFSNNLQNKNAKDGTFQEIPYSTSHVKILKDSSFQDIPHSSTDASSTHILTVENLENSMIHNIPHISADASNRISMHREDTQLPIELSFNGMVKSLLKLNPIWLQEQFKMSHPPPDVIQGVKILPDFFTSYESYAASFFPLLKLKIWQFMFEASKSVLPNIQNGKRFSFRILSDVIKSDYIELKCESVVNSKCDLEPCEGVMTILEMNTNSHQSYPLFGFIIKHKVNPLNLNLLHHCWRKIPAEYLKDAKRLIFHVWIKRKELLFEKDILMSGNRICYLRNSLRLVDALLCFKDSPLMTDIIKPRLPTFALTFSESSSNSEYTPRQLEIIHAVCSEIYKPYLECKITLIRGPSGTGKTHIIIGILKTLFHASEYNSNLKILVTAPSNGAVDEIGCRLIELNERCGWRDAIKFVRVGVEKKVPSKMLPFFLDRKAEALYEKHKERELQALRLKISNLEKEPNSLIKKKELQNLNEQCKFIEDNFSLKKAHYKTEIKYKCDILKESHIVLTTLSGCNLSILCKTFLPTSKSDLNFSCCIVDQSTRCTELEILQPLAFGISKLILVGDDRQLPAAHSECSNHNRSMLERFCQYFRSSNQPSPVVSLTEQFHVHPSTCQFPSTSKDI